jgi:hypothetical protein
MALIPFYDRCGPQGTRSERRQRPGTKKRGPRPDRVRMTEDPALIGPALGDVRERMIAGVTQFYRVGVSRARAWRQTKQKYFSTRYVQHGATAIPVEPLAQEAPSYKQFYNLIAELDTSLDLTRRNADTSTWNLSMRGVLGSSRQHLFGDNGELSGLHADDLPGTLGINPQNAAVRRGDWKPSVEQQFRLTHVEQVDFLPGAIKARERDVRKRQYVLDACLTLHELTSILIRRFVRFNHTSYRADCLPEGMVGQNVLDATPLSIWNWGLTNMAGAANVRSRQEIWTNLLPRATASVRPRGLYFEQRHYSNARMEHEQWFARTRVKRRCEHVEIRHLPYDPSTIWIRNDEAGDWEPCQLVDRDEQFRLARREELWDRVKLLGAAKENKANASRELTARFVADTDAIVRSAQKEARDARKGLSRAERTRDIKVNRLRFRPKPCNSRKRSASCKS